MVAKCQCLPMILMFFSLIMYHVLSHLHTRVYIHVKALFFFCLNYKNQASGYFRFPEIFLLQHRLAVN